MIQGLILVLLSVLAVRLYMLQIVSGARYAEIAENQRIRLLPIPAPRGLPAIGPRATMPSAMAVTSPRCC